MGIKCESENEESKVSIFKLLLKLELISIAEIARHADRKMRYEAGNKHFYTVPRMAG